MQKMKNGKKVLSVCLSLAMAAGMLSTSAFASWNVYGGSDNHNAVVTEAPTGTPTVASINLLNSNSGWDGVDNVPLLQTENGVTYAYVLYDGHAAGAHLAKIDCEAAIEKAQSGEDIYKAATEWDVQLESSSGFQLSTPVLHDDTVYAATNSGKIYAVSTESGEKELVTSVSTGQINTPLTIYGDYLYFGTWVGNGSIEGSREPGRYYQLNLNDYTDMQSVSSIERGFYWAGAVSDGTNIYFGGDDGYLYYRPVGAGFGTKSDVEIKNTALKLTDVASDAGNVRSTIMMDEDGLLYFTTQGGYLWCCSYEDGLMVEWKAKLGATSTSTPTKVGDRIYVGYYSGFNAGGVQCVTVSFDEEENVVTSVAPVASGFPVQSSIVVMGDGTGTDYLYFNTNAQKGAGYCYSYDGTTGSKVWGTTGDTYALGGMAIDNGYAVFGNDYNHLYVVHD